MNQEYAKALVAAGAKVLAYESFGSYQGDWWARVEFDGKSGYVHGSYGSCSVCDAFEAEFGWNEDECEEHRYSGHKPDCSGCVATKAEFSSRLEKFGREYLDDILTHEAAITKASENLEWDRDAEDMVRWLEAQQ